MKAPTRRSHYAFTLVELLVIIAIIAVLAALLLPVGGGPRRAGKIARARMETGMISASIAAYQGTYGRFPVSSNVVNLAAAAKSDFTYGGPALKTVLGPGNWTADNSEVMAILLDLENYGNGTPTINKDHVMNPLRTKYLNANMVNDTNSAGIGKDGIYRDPWGNPYIISLDLDNDGNCRDAFYGLRAVSQQDGPTGFNGLVNSRDPAGAGDNFACTNAIMVWSLGPDIRASTNQAANAGPNKDNILSW